MIATIFNQLFVHNSTFKMSGQAKISSFLKPLQQKRPNEDNLSENKTPPKKTKVSPKKTPEKSTTSSTDQENIANNQKSSPLTPDEKKKISENQVSAKIKITAKETHGLVVNIGPTWFKALEPQFSKPYFTRLSQFVESERQKHTIYPPASLVWSWTQMGDIRDVKAVILGQDPYHGPSQAHGLCFSVQRGVSPPPSLLNMFKELENDIPGFTRPGHGTLSGWSQQGVLLLNAVLTVESHKANSHKDKGWEQLTDAVISWLNKNMEGVVFMLWGSYAQKKGSFIDKKRHHVLAAVHPSPLSAHRGFFGCKHFSKCNELLQKQGKKPIDWTDLSA